jgi:hypothetical protein
MQVQLSLRQCFYKLFDIHWFRSSHVLILTCRKGPGLSRCYNLTLLWEQTTP